MLGKPGWGWLWAPGSDWCWDQVSASLCHAGRLEGHGWDFIPLGSACS